MYQNKAPNFLIQSTINVSLLFTLGFHPLAYGNSPPKNKAPEVIIRSAYNQLESIRTRLDSLINSSESPSYLYQKTDVEEHLHQGLAQFQKKNYRMALKHFEDFHSRAQVLKTTEFSTAQFKSGVVVAKQTKSQRATYHWLNTISEGIIKKPPDHELILRGTREILKIDHSREIRVHIYSALSSIALEGDFKAQLLYELAKNAILKDMYKLAERWIAIALSSSPPRSLKNNLIYLQALILNNESKIDESIHQLKSVVALSKPQEPIADLARIALSQIYTKKKQLNNAYGILKEVPESSKFYDQSISLLIFTAIDLKDYEGALHYIGAYLDRQPKSENWYRARVLKIFLQLKAGDLDGAKESIHFQADGLDKSLIQFHKNIARPSEDYQSIVEKTLQIFEGWLPNSPLVERLHNVHSKRNRLWARSVDLTNQINSMLESIAYQNLHQLYPLDSQLHHRIDKILFETIQAGHFLSGAMITMLEGEFTPTEKSKLKQLKQRRLSHPLGPRLLLNQIDSWNHFLNFNQLEQKLNSIKGRFNHQISVLNNQFYNSSLSNKTPQSSLLNTRRYLESWKKSFDRAATLTYRSKLSNLKKTSRIAPIRKGFIQQVETIDQEFDILIPKFYSSHSPRQRLLYNQNQEAALFYKDTANRALQVLSKLENKVNKNAQDLVSNISSLTEDLINIQNRLDSMEAGFANLFIKLRPILSQAYDLRAQKRLAIYGKLDGDLKWLRFRAVQNLNASNKEKLEVDKENVIGNFYDIENGVIW